MSNGHFPLHPDSLNTGTVLVVDDQPINIQIIYQILGESYRVLMATNAEQALSVCKKSMPDLVLLDVMMPNISGLEICQLMKADPDIRDIPVIFVTGAQGQAEEDACWSAGGIDFIQKPFTPNTLRHRVNAHLTLKRQSDLLRSLAFVDGLTGTWNRRYFDQYLDSQIALAKRKDSALSLLLLDIDYFKRYNDHYGHLAGDDTLRRVAQAAKSCCNRPADIVARYGGEEFGVILPDTDSSGANVVAEKILTTISALDIPHLQSDFGHVTVSIGAAVNLRHGATALIAAADQQLYNAKSSGRNQYQL